MRREREFSPPPSKRGKTARATIVQAGMTAPDATPAGANCQNGAIGDGRKTSTPRCRSNGGKRSEQTTIPTADNGHTCNPPTAPTLDNGAMSLTDTNVSRGPFMSVNDTHFAARAMPHKLQLRNLRSCCPLA